jgi:hypothetical protein
MAQVRHTGNIQPSLDVEEHDHLEGGVAVKKVGIYNWNQSLNNGVGDWERGSSNKSSIVNSTATPLDINGTFTGQWEDVLPYSEIIVSIFTDKPSVTDGLKIEWSKDGVNVHGDDVFTISANSGKTFSFPRQNRYMRVRYTNDGVAQTTFNIETILNTVATKGSSHRLKDNLVQEDDAIVTKSLIVGFSTAGGQSLENVKVNPSGALTVEVGTSALPTGAATEVTLEKIRVNSEEYGLNDYENASATVTYVGKEDKNGTYVIIKIDSTTGYAVTYATIANNPTRTTYALAWTNRATLTYEKFATAI